MAVVISSDLVLNPAEAAIPLTYPRILYQDIFRDGTITASTEEDDAPGENVADGLTWDFWRPTALPATLEVQTDAAADVDYAWLGPHTLGTCECTVKGEYWDGDEWIVLFAEYAPGTDRVVAFLFEQVTASRFRFVISGSGDVPSIAIAMMGKALAMQRSVTLDHKPITMQRKTVARPSVSEGGQTLGRSIQRMGIAGQIAFEHLEASWLRTHFEPFIESARVYPFGWVWSPASYPTEVAFCWTPSGKEDIRPEHSGLQDRMDVAFDVEGVIE
jgi:hypothetical protein